jgi:hypothetical protein
VRRLFELGIALAVLATIGLGAAWASAPGRLALELDVYIRVVGGLAVLMVVAVTREAFPLEGESAVAKALQEEPAEPLRPRDLERLERELTLAASTAFDVHFRLRPTLRDIAAEELAARGLRLDDGGPAVEAALGDEVWQLVRPDREPPLRRFDPGLEEDQVRRVVERLETL